MAIWTFRCVGVPLTEDQLKGLLKRFDTNGDGRLSKKELKVAFRSLGLKHSGWRAKRALKHADANGDGFISEEEMNQLVNSRRLMEELPHPNNEPDSCVNFIGTLVEKMIELDSTQP